MAFNPMTDDGLSYLPGAQIAGVWKGIVVTGSFRSTFRYF